MALPEGFPFFRIGDVVQHKESKRVGKVERFQHPGTDIWVDSTGPYPQMDFVKLVPEKKAD